MKIGRLKKALEKSWGKDTCYKPMKKDYEKNHPSYGQCYGTALIVNDFFGGKILRYKFPEGADHFSNLIEGEEVDLTREQFDKDEKFPKPEVIERKDLKSKEIYVLLKKRLMKILKK